MAPVKGAICCVPRRVHWRRLSDERSVTVADSARVGGLDAFIQNVRLRPSALMLVPRRYRVDREGDRVSTLALAEDRSWYGDTPASAGRSHFGPVHANAVAGCAADGRCVGEGWRTRVPGIFGTRTFDRQSEPLCVMFSLVTKRPSPSNADLHHRYAGNATGNARHISCARTTTPGGSLFGCRTPTTYGAINHRRRQRLSPVLTSPRRF